MLSTIWSTVFGEEEQAATSQPPTPPATPTEENMTNEKKNDKYNFAKFNDKVAQRPSLPQLTMVYAQYGWEYLTTPDYTKEAALVDAGKK